MEKYDKSLAQFQGVSEIWYYKRKKLKKTDFFSQLK